MPTGNGMSNMAENEAPNTDICATLNATSDTQFGLVLQQIMYKIKHKSSKITSEKNTKTYRYTKQTKIAEIWSFKTNITETAIVTQDNKNMQENLNQWFSKWAPWEIFHLHQKFKKIKRNLELFHILYLFLSLASFSHSFFLLLPLIPFMRSFHPLLSPVPFTSSFHLFLSLVPFFFI